MTAPGPARSADRLLAIDVGTQSVRALLFDPRGALLAGSRIPIEPYVSPQPGWAEQDPEVYWAAMGAACAALRDQPAGRPIEAIAGLALTTQRGTVVVTDRAGRPLRPAMVWLDQRRTYGLPPLGGLTGLAFRALRVRDTVAAFQADAEANWIAHHEPTVWAAAERYGLLSAFLSTRLVGRWVDADACQVGYLPFDFRRRRWAADGDWRWRVAPIRREQLPDLVPSGEPLGSLTPAAADHLGLPAGLPVMAAAADKACEVLGSGALDPSVAALSYGTAATVNTTHRRYVEAVPLVPPYPAAVPGAYSLEIQVYRGYWLVEWFKRQFGDREVARAAAAGTSPEALFDELLEATTPGAMGLLLQPTWTPGVRVPGPEAKGAVIGFSDVHTRAHLYRAILEGLAYALREGLERSERRSGVRAAEVRVAGGGSRSRGALQLTADIFGRPAARPHTDEAAGLGAAIVAAYGLGLHRDAETAVREMTRVGESRDPEPDAVAIYEELYQRVYRRLYPALRPLYEDVRRITGHPPRP
ncbi:MAG TPA: FGGY-family carbohydrate kinase [Candidatus Limnocylindrales bacterium]|nr:FGGY-family carbohydrate kinase [Candidatus Limnocylindrales bacterium]